MDRKEFLHSFMGKKVRRNLARVSQRNLIDAPGLEPYTGPWTYELAGHLLRRATFGPTHQLISQAVTQGMDRTVNELLKSLPLPAPPLRYIANVNDTNCALGETWVDKPMNGESQVIHRRYSIQAWNFQQLLNEGMSVREKLTLFWINHFGCGNNPDVRADYVYVQLLRAGCLGSFKQLVKDVTITPAMLHFLNGDVNERGAPNENFARELLELFTIGKGPQIAPGDYTHYTEQDILELAKCFSGWRIRGFWGANNLPYTEGYFDPQYHDTSTKKLSAKFNNTQIPNGGDKEYANVIDIIFRQEEVALFICRKLYRWFCYYDITKSTEIYVIRTMADILRRNNFEIKPVLEALFKSQHFYDALFARGPMIKNPIDYMLSVLKQSHVTFPSNWQDKYSICLLMTDWLENWQMHYFGVPGVAGWKAYYQSPLYYRMWINASSLQQHQVFVTRILGFGYQIKGDGTGTTIVLKVSPLEMLKNITKPSDPNEVINGLSAIFFPMPLPQVQKDALKYILLPGLPDFEWTVEYNNYKNDPNNVSKKTAVEARLKNVLASMYMLAEFHLS